MEGTPAPVPASPLRLALLAVLAGCGVASVLVVGEVRGAEGAPTAYSALSPGAAALDLGAGLGLLAAGGAAAVLATPRLRSARHRVGVLLALAGAAWLAADWVGWAGGPATARSLAMVAAPFLLALVVHLAAAFPGGRVAGPGAVLTVAAYVVAAVAGLGRALIRDPFLDRYCWSNCTDNDLLVSAQPGAARLLTGGWLRATVVVGIALVGLCGWRLLRAGPVARRASGPVLVPAALAGLAEAVYAALLVHDPAEDPERAVFAGVFAARAAALGALAAGVAWCLVRAGRARRSVARLVDDLGDAPAPGTLRSALARSLGDDRLDVAFWIPSTGGWVDAAGRAAAPEPGPGQAATTLARGGQPVAVVIHDRAVATLHDLDHELGAAARLAVDNERLRAEALVQLDELRASRSRIVAAGDATRRRLERDLHDGAQQTLLAALYELRLAASSAERAGAADVAATLVEAGAEAQRTIDDLRELAHGIFPAILTEAGLGPALWTLADRAPLPVEIADLGAVGEARYPAGAETAAYLVVAGAVDDAAGRGATHVTVSITVAGAPARSGSGSAPVDGPAASTKAWSGPDPAVDPGLAGVAAVAAPWTASGAGTRTATGAASGSRTAPSVGGDPSGGAVRLVVEARDDGSAPADGRLVHVADRVSALGGRLELDGTAVRAVIPCG